MSVSTAIDSSRRSNARLSRLVPDGFPEGGLANDHAQQPPALFQRPIAAGALPPLAAADRRVSSRSASGADGRNRGETTNVPDHARNRSSQQRPSRTGRQSIVRSAPPVPQAAMDLLSDASRGLGTAMAATTVADRYAAAHLAALRAAAAVLAARARPVRGRRGSAWELISKVAPEFAEWAAFFAAGSAKRQAAEAGIQRLVSPREADDMVRQVAAFLDLVEESLRAG